MKLTSGFQLSNGFTFSVNRAIGWSSFDIEISGQDVIQRTRLSREALTIVLKEFRKKGVIRIKNVELTVPNPVERAMLLEQAEAVMRQEVI